MIITHYSPSDSLLPYIDRYWSCNSGGERDIDLYPFVAGTGVELFIHFSSSFHANGKKLASAHLTCCRQLTFINPAGALNFFAVRFRYGAFRHFCPVNFSELNNCFSSVPDIWGSKGKQLTERLNDAGPIADKAAVVDRFLLQQLQRYNKFTPTLDAAISCIYENYQNVDIMSLAKQQNISLRHFERSFKNEFGLSPKRFQVIRRFQSSIRKMLLTPGVEYSDMALENGYYDQSHFIKECRAMANMTPLELLNMNNKSCHFFFAKNRNNVTTTRAKQAKANA